MSLDHPNTQALRRMMAAHGWRATQIARIFEVKPQTVRAWMCGTRVIPDDKLSDLMLTERIGAGKLSTLSTDSKGES